MAGEEWERFVRDPDDLSGLPASGNLDGTNITFLLTRFFDQKTIHSYLERTSQKRSFRAWRMAWQLITGILLFFGNIGVLSVLAYKVMKFSELEEDYQNPTDFAKDMNRVFPFELCLLGTLFSMQLFNAIFYTSWLQLLLLVIHVVYFGYHAKLYIDNKWKVDPASVWGNFFKDKMKRNMFGGLGFAGTCFFLYLYNMIQALTPPTTTYVVK